MAYAVGLLVLLVGLLASIALHEVGHMVPAKRFGVRVSQYMVGFGPTLFSRTKGETEYGLKAIPLGGYVRLVGMYPPADAVGATRGTGRFAGLIDAARDASAEEIRPGEDHRAFYRLSTPKKVVVMLGGPLMNLLIAVVLVGIILVGIGTAGGAATTTVGVVGQCLLPADAPADRVCTSSDPEVPAVLAGLQPGDTIVSYGGVPTSTWSEVQQAIATTPGTDISMVVERDGTQVTLSVSPVTVDRPVRDADGAVVTNADGSVQLAPQRYVGFSPTAALERQPVSTVLPAVGDAVGQTVAIVATLPARLVDVVQATVGNEPRDTTSVVGVVGIGRFAGEIAEAPGLGIAQRVASMLGLLASLNIALFVFNMVPLVPLDGGHVAGALWEGAKRQVARLRGAPRPAPVDVARMMPVAYGVFVLLAVVGLVLVYADIAAPVSL